MMIFVSFMVVVVVLMFDRDIGRKGNGRQAIETDGWTFQR
jgi:hypothetical protein